MDPFGTPPPPQTPQSRMEREYVWAAHDAAGVNELHVAIDWFDREAWPIQDPHNQSVYGYTDPVGELVEQRVYTPFGQILNADKTPLAKPSGLYFDFRLRVGMHGMFAERLDAGTTDPLLRHPDARVVYLTPNRTYDPQTGLWWQRDPNATGLLTQGALARGRSAPLMGAKSPDSEEHYTDGLNTYEANRSNPIGFQDPSGLSAFVLGFGGFGIDAGLRADEIKVKGGILAGIAAKLGASITAEGIVIGGFMGLMVNAGLAGDEVDRLAAWISDMTGIDILGIGFAAYSGGGHPSPDSIAADMTPQQYETHGNPGQWKFDGEKPGSGAPGRIPGDVKIYEWWVTLANRLVEVHYFRDASGAIKESTVKFIENGLR